MAWLKRLEDCIMSGNCSVPGSGFYCRIGVVLMTVLPIMWSGSSINSSSPAVLSLSPFEVVGLRSEVQATYRSLAWNTPTLFPNALPSSYSALALRWSKTQRIRFGPSLALYPSMHVSSAVARQIWRNGLGLQKSPNSHLWSSGMVP